MLSMSLCPYGRIISIELRGKIAARIGVNKRLCVKTAPEIKTEVREEYI